MTKGVLIYSFNSKTVSYNTIANLCAMLVRHFLQLPISVVTDDPIRLEESLFDRIIQVDSTTTNKDAWRNTDRDNYYTLSPYDETLVIDSDYLIFNDRLRLLFDYTEDIILSHKARKINLTPVDEKEQWVSATSLPMSWATCFYFRKSKLSEDFFKLVTYVKENFLLYYSLYHIKSKVFRNDFVFSIARHIFSGGGENALASNPFVLLTAYPDSEILKISKSGLIMTDLRADSKVQILTHQNVHVLNKATLIEHYESFRELFI